MSLDADLPIVTTPAPTSVMPADRPGLPGAARGDALAFAEALWSSDGVSPPPADRLAFFGDDLSDFVGHLNTRARLLFRTSLAAITWIAPLRIGRVARLRSLTIEERVRAIRTLEQTPVSLAIFLVKAICSVVWYEHPDTAREIGWDQRCKKH